MTDLYKVVLKGKAISGWENQKVKKNLTAIFKAPPEKIEHLLSGKPFTVKKNVDREQAVRMARRLKKAGAECKIIKQKTSVLKSAATGKKTKPKLKLSRVTILLFILCLSGILFFYFNKQNNKKIYTAKNTLTSEYNNENEWIITEILTDIAKIICYKKHSVNFSPDDISISLKRSDNADYEVSLKLPGQQDTFKTIISINKNNHIWSEKVYTDFANELIVAMGLNNTINNKIDTDLYIFNFLLNTSIENFERQNKIISGKLEANIFDANAHEEAALLLAMLSMREYAGVYTDIRKNINRMTVHLAIASALGKEAATTTNIKHRYANVLISLLINDQQDAIEKLDKMETIITGLTRPAIFQSWHHALRTRITGDWRILKNKEKLSMFESMEIYRAMCESIGSDQAVQWLKKNEQLKIPFTEVARVTVLNDPSVSNGHLFCKNGVANELTEVKKIKSHLNLDKHKNLVSFLNRTDTHCISQGSNNKIHVKVINEGVWAGFFQRHLISRTSSEYNFYNHNWGVPDRAKSFKKQMKKLLKGLYLFPVFELLYSDNDKESKTAVKKLIPLTSRHPEYFNAGEWSWMRQQVARREYPTGTTNLREWFQPWILQGTIYELNIRYHWGAGTGQEKTNYFKSNYKRAPYDYQLVSEYIEITEKELKPSGEQIIELYGPMIKYNTRAMRKVASFYKDKNSDEYIKIMTDMCELEPHNFFNLGEYLVTLGKKVEAAKAYQNAIDRSTNAVAIANRCDWLVNYYYDIGKEDKAYSIAMRAAKAYSASGLETMADLLDKMNRLSEAEDYYKRIEKRYDSPGELTKFYLKHSDIPEYKKKYEKTLKKTFPHGLKKVTIASFKNKPKKGVSILSYSQRLHRYNLERGDIIVAIDGYLVENLEQYYSIRSLSDNPKIEFIVWTHGSYKLIKAELKDRKFGVSIGTYPK